MPLDMTTLSLPLPLRMGKVNCYLIRPPKGYVLIDTGGSNARKELRRQLEDMLGVTLDRNGTLRVSRIDKPPQERMASAP